jgi:uncharacterized protein YkwD
MKQIPVLFLLLSCTVTSAQVIDSLNTAKNCLYMTVDEREMIYEINRLRSNPKSYLQYIAPKLAEARKHLKEYGKGAKNYSLTYTGKGTAEQTIDTTWHYQNEENVKALATLEADLKKLKPLSVLRPDSGLYLAAKKHVDDNNQHEWKLMHTGSDGSHPWDRIKKYSPGMTFGNENIAGSSGTPTPRGIVLQLLIDAGIPGYGHRYNMLDGDWTHVACASTLYNEWMNWWVQNFGQRKK